MATYPAHSRYYQCPLERGLCCEELVTAQYPYTTVVVLATEHGCPELVSQRVYNTPHYWWVLCRYNGILLPEHCVAGLQLRAPVLTSLPRRP